MQVSGTDGGQADQPQTPAGSPSPSPDQERRDLELERRDVELRRRELELEQREAAQRDAEQRLAEEQARVPVVDLPPDEGEGTQEGTEGPEGGAPPEPEYVDVVERRGLRWSRTRQLKTTE